MLSVELLNFEDATQIHYIICNIFTELTDLIIEGKH